MARQRKQEPTEVDMERGRAFAAWMRAARERRGWGNKKQLAEAAGLSNTYIGVLENDGINNATESYQRPSEETIAKIAAATGADINAGRAAAGYAPLPDDGPHGVVMTPSGKRYVVRRRLGDPAQPFVLTDEAARVLEALEFLEETQEEEAGTVRQ